MLNKKKQRLRRARRTRLLIADKGVARICVARSNSHMSASLISPCGQKVLATASTQEAELKKALDGKSSTVQAAAEVGKRIADKAKKLGYEKVAFDRSGFAYHGRIKALADAARESGLQF